MTPSPECAPEAGTAPAEPAEFHLPEDATFSYVVTHEAWYAQVVKGREINVQAAHVEGGVLWEFMVEEVDLGQRVPSIRVKVFDDAFAAFAQIPAFFGALAGGSVTRLEQVIALLDRIGAKDVTGGQGLTAFGFPRFRPRCVAGLVALGWTPPEGTQ